MMHNGLSSHRVSELQSQYGLNIIKSSQTKTWLSMLFDQFKDTLIIILCIAAIIAGFHNITEALVIAVIILLNAAIGFIQEFRTERTLQALNSMISQRIRVLRDGTESMLETKYIVPEDIVLLSEGDKIPADGILLEAHNVSIEESALTGESVPVEKNTGEQVFMGTAMVRGSGILQVTDIGIATEFGQIASLTTQTQQTKSPIQKELSTIGLFVAKMAGIISLLLLGIHIFRNIGAETSLFAVISEGIVFAVSVAVAAVPEGLPTTITVALALGASVLAKKRAVVKKLSSVETLGTVSTICSDKTGTLTKNEMTVQQLISSSEQVISFTGVGYNPEQGSIEGDIKDHRELLRIADIAYYCNEAKLIKSVDGGYETLGDPTEAALLTMAEKIYTFDEEDKVSYVREGIFPFDSERKLMSVVATNTYEDSFVFVKGSPDHVLEKCTQYWNGEEVAPLTTEIRTNIRGHYNDMAESALRVLATAYKKATEHPETLEHAESELIYTGLIGMIDPPREDVRDAIVQTKSAGIRTIVITGDYGTTASVIAQKLGIVDKDKHRVITGDELEDLSDSNLRELLNHREYGMIFARTRPAQKMRIVDALQANGEVVAMTGDGVNDAPALKRSDVGVAMGITGTDVSKEAATLILLDDSFSTIVNAVQEGRRIYDNLKKFVLYTLSSNVGELFVIFLSIISGIPLILTAILILTINLGTDILPAIALGVDPAESNLMSRQPRDPSLRVLNKKFIKRLFFIGSVIGITVVAAFIFSLWNYGWQWGTEIDGELLVRGQTLAFATLVISQLFNSFSVKSYGPLTLRHLRNNLFHQIAIFVSILIVVAVVYVPSMNTFLGTSPLDLTDWVVIMVSALIPVSLFEFMKRFRSF